MTDYSLIVVRHYVYSLFHYDTFPALSVYFERFFLISWCFGSRAQCEGQSQGVWVRMQASWNWYPGQSEIRWWEARIKLRSSSRSSSRRVTSNASVVVCGGGSLLLWALFASTRWPSWDSLSDEGSVVSAGGEDLLLDTARYSSCSYCYRCCWCKEP